MYTWGYLKDVILAKLDLEEKEAETQNLIKRFPLFANEAMTQICSSIKPNHTFFEIDVTKEMLGTPVKMPDDFISFDDDVNTISYYDVYGIKIVREACDEDFTYLGHKHLIFKLPGTYQISYNAKWISFTNMDNDTELDVPEDILNCIPSYVASQCYKIDDEYKSSVYRNEYEIFLARIDDTHFKNSKTLRVEGDW